MFIVTFKFLRLLTGLSQKYIWVYWWLVRVTFLSGCFWLFAPKFWEVTGTNVSLSFFECRFSGCWRSDATLCKKNCLNFLYSRERRGFKKFGLECSRLSHVENFHYLNLLQRCHHLMSIIAIWVTTQKNYVPDIRLWRLFIQKLEYFCKASCFRILQLVIKPVWLTLIHSERKRNRI